VENGASQEGREICPGLNYMMKDSKKKGKEIESDRKSQ
jgi:hypothetical protein